ncbi:MAG: hypothetical protein ABID54_05305 [Pseudomonadota bacterium]
MNTSQIEKRIENLEERLRPRQDKPLSFSDLSNQEAQDFVAFFRGTCHAYHGEFGGQPPAEPDQSLSIQDQLRIWVQQSVQIVKKFILEFHISRIRGTDHSRLVERSRDIPELRVLVDLAEKPFLQRKQA